MTRLPKIGDFITVKPSFHNNPYIPLNARLLVVSLGNPMNGEPTVVNVQHHGRPYICHVTHIKAIITGQEKVSFT